MRILSTNINIPYLSKPQLSWKYTSLFQKARIRWAGNQYENPMIKAGSWLWQVAFITKMDLIMYISNELRYLLSNLSEILPQRLLQPSFKKFEKYFPSYRADKLGIWKDTQTDRKTDRQRGRIDRQIDAGNDNNSPTSRWWGKINISSFLCYESW